MKTRLTLAIVLVLAPRITAQELLWTKTGVLDTYSLGGWIAVLGDINGDQYEDIMNHGQSLPVEGPAPSRIWFVSGSDGSTLRVRPAGYNNQVRFERFVGAGDMDGDQIPDYAAIIRDGNVNVYQTILEVSSGSDDRIIWRDVRSWDGLFGYAIIGNLDVDGDQRPDVLVSDVRVQPGGAIYAYSHSGKLLYTVLGTDELSVGRSLARVGDVDGDRCDDYVSGGAGPDSLGRAILISGRSGTVIRMGTGELSNDWLGHAVTGCGDMDGDAVPDFAASNSDFGTGRCVVRAFSGRTAAPLYTWTGGPPVANQFGWAMDGGIDMDQDGIPDLVLSAPAELIPPNQGGTTYSFSGRDGGVIFRNTLGDRMGYSLAAMKPQPSSPFPLVFVCDPFFGYAGPRLNGLGRILCFRGNPAGTVAFGQPGAGTLPTAPRIGLRDLGVGLRLHLSGAEPGVVAFLMLGLSRTTWAGHPLPLSLTPFGFPECALFVSPDLLLAATTGTTGISRGYASFDLMLPLALPPGIVTLHGQWLVLGTGSHSPGGVTAALLWRH